MLKDLYYIVCKDKINKKFEGYTELLPKQGFTKSDAKTRYFIVVFEKKDGTIW